MASPVGTFLLGTILGAVGGFGFALYLNERSQLPRFAPFAPKQFGRPSPSDFKSGWYLFGYRPGGGQPKQIERLPSQEAAIAVFKHSITVNDGYVHKIIELRNVNEFDRFNNQAMSRAEYETLVQAQASAKAA